MNTTLLLIALMVLLGPFNKMSVKAQGLIDDDDGLIQEGPESETSQDDDDPIIKENSPTSQDDDESSGDTDASELVSSGDGTDGLETDDQLDKSNKEDEYLSDLGDLTAIGIRVRLAPLADEGTVQALRDAVTQYASQNGYDVTINTDDWAIDNREMTIMVNGANGNDVSTELASLVSEYRLVRDVDPIFENDATTLTLSVGVVTATAIAAAL